MVSEQISPLPAALSDEQRRGLFIMRAMYFLYFGGVGGYWTFLNVYYREIGLSGTQIGMINTLAPLVAIFSATLWGLLNDRLGSPRRVLRVALPGVIAGAIALSSTTSFYLITLFSCLMALFNSASIPLMDNTTLRLLGERRGEYGRYRVLGSAGFILTSLFSGYLYAVTGLRWIFYVYALITTLLLLASNWLPNEPVRLSGSVWGGMGSMVRNRAWLVFAASAMLLWISNNGTMNFIGIVVRDMGGSEQLIGLVWMMSAVAEIPIMFYGDRLMRRFGHTRLLVTAFSTFTLRAALLAVMPRPEWAVGISILSGLSFSLFWISAVSYANESAPEHLKSTAQGLLFSIMNLAGMAGSLGSGYLFDAAGPRGLFWAMSLAAASGLLVFGVNNLRKAKTLPEGTPHAVLDHSDG